MRHLIVARRLFVAVRFTVRSHPFNGWTTVCLFCDETSKLGPSASILPVVHVARPWGAQSKWTGVVKTYGLPGSIFRLCSRW